jgi:hypothetical protein
MGARVPVSTDGSRKVTPDSHLHRGVQKRLLICRLVVEDSKRSQIQRKKELCHLHSKEPRGPYPPRA